MRREDQERALEEVISRTVHNASERGSRALEAAVADTLYYEQQRLKTAKPSKRRDKERSRYSSYKSRLLRGSDHQRKMVLREMVDSFAREILGNFDPRVHALATRAVPFGLKTLLNATSPRQLVAWRGPGGVNLEEHVVVDGELEHALALRDRGTLILAPTHSSNLDSIVLGYGLHEAGFPPLLYGAGLNLFDNPLMSFFMQNLGAYKVDRRKKAPIYKQVLKEYATVSLELGYHNLFFPGGTRSRSNLIEQKLKLGLLGTGLSAYQNRLRAKHPRPKVFVVPLVLSYELVLEGKTLIDDHLRDVGRSRYIITDDEFASAKRIYQFMRGLLELDTKIYLTLMPPRDPFGNPVDREGNSLDSRGRRIDIERYLMNSKGELSRDNNRDQEYTRELGHEISRAYLQGNTVLPTHAVAFAVFEHLRGLESDPDLYRWLRTGGQTESISLGEASRVVDELVNRLKELESQGKVRLSTRVRECNGQDLLMSALKGFGTYHDTPALERRGDRIYHHDRNLLYYYRNRLVHYGLERVETAV
ncbi:MAG: 1-acyl-sn-glycerol-3-phosphate acyltransferase [Planctomycetes bacterium]|nr:1-acyl-sn-glycerol-3-phosphate acyltransferase [Planctomycetota bacterium]